VTTTICLTPKDFSDAILGCGIDRDFLRRNSIVRIAKELVVIDRWVESHKRQSYPAFFLSSLVAVETLLEWSGTSDSHSQEQDPSPEQFLLF
jgi:hypothetical protein